MDPLSSTPAPSASTTQQPAPLVAHRSPTSAAAAAAPAVDRKKAVTEPGTGTPQRDSRSVQYLVQDNRVITTIVDDNSKKVVVQIPDAELIRIAKSIDRMQGFFIEQKA